MNVLRHDDVAANDKIISLAHHLKRSLKKFACGRTAEIWETAITTEGNEVEVPGLMVTDQPTRHLQERIHPVRATFDVARSRVSKARPGAPKVCGWIYILPDLGHPPENEMR